MISKIFPMVLFLVLALGSFSGARESTEPSALRVEDGSREDLRRSIIVIPLANHTGEDKYNPLCSTITETVSLVFRFLKDYRLVEDADLGLLEAVADAGAGVLRDAAAAEGASEVVSGRMVREEGVFRFSIALFNAAEGRITNSQEAEAGSVLEVFDAGDELTEGLIAQLADVRIAFGSIIMKQTGGRGNYTVLLDGYPLRNPEKTFRRVLNGSYELSVVQRRLTGTETVFSRTLEVREGEAALVEFEIPPAHRREFDWLELRGDELLRLGREKESFELFMEELSLFQNRTLALEYDKDLEDMRDGYIRRAGALAGRTLEENIARADASFYDKKVRFDETLEEYEDLSSLVRTEYGIAVLEGDRFSEPRGLESIGGRRILFDALTPEGEPALFLWDRGTARLVERPLTGKRDQPFGGDFAVSGNRIFLWNPGEEDIQVLDMGLELRERLPVAEDESSGTSGILKEGVRLAASPGGQLYLISDSGSLVIDTLREVDERGELLPPDRYPAIEERLRHMLGGLRPGDVFFDAAHRLNVFIPASGELYLFDGRGNLLNSLHLSESESGSRIAVDDGGFLYLTLYHENSILRYSPSGEVISSYGRYGTRPGEFALPSGIALDGDVILVADSYNGRIQRLEPLGVPVVSPELARYGKDLERRIDRTGTALILDHAARDDIGWKNHRGNLIGTASFLGASFGFTVLGDVFGKSRADAVYDDTVNNESDAAERADRAEFLQKGSDMLSFASFGAAAGYATSTLLGLGLDGSLRGYNRRQIQSLDMDREYEPDPRRYRSIRRSSQIGIWTGIVPPVLGAAGFMAVVANGMEVNQALGYVLMGSIITPPIFSHLHAGRFSVGLLLAGLAADALLLWGYNSMDNDDGLKGWNWSMDRYDVGESGGGADIGRALERAGDFSAVYLISAAFGVRIAAGIYRTRNGWTYTNNYNRFKAVREKRAAGELSLLDLTPMPYIARDGGIGLAVDYRF